MEKLAYDVKEVAQLLGISKSKVYVLIKENQIPHLELGKRKVIPKNRFEEWMQENTVTIDIKEKSLL